MYDIPSTLCVGFVMGSFVIISAVHMLLWWYVEPSNGRTSFVWGTLNLILASLAVLTFVYKEQGGFDTLSGQFVPFLAAAFAILFGLYTVYAVLKDPQPQHA